MWEEESEEAKEEGKKGMKSHYLPYGDDLIAFAQRRGGRAHMKVIIEIF